MEECDHKGHKVVCPSSEGPCCEGCGEPWPYEDKKPQEDKLPSRQSIDDTVDTCLRIWFGNYDKMDEADKETYRVPMREIVSLVAVAHTGNAITALQEISSLGFVAAKDAPEAHDEVVNIAMSALSREPKIMKSIQNGHSEYCKFVDLEEVGFMTKVGDSLDINFDDDLSWKDGEKIYRVKRK